MNMIPRLRPALISLVFLAGLSACGGPAKFKRYDGPAVTQVVVNKGARQMLLYSGDQVIKAYRIGLGNQPVGDKVFEGDGRTPEGRYYIDRRNPDSSYHLSLGINYPRPQDVAEAGGRDPGSDIFIHGRGSEGNAKAPLMPDWTAGCIAVTDAEIEDIYAMVPDGTPVLITP